MKALLIAIILAGLAIAGVLWYRSTSTGTLQVEPHAREEIEKARRR